MTVRRMGLFTLVAFFVFVLLVLTSVSCVMRGPEGTRRAVESSTGADYDRELGLTLGRVSLAIARAAVDEEDEVYLDGLSRVRVGIYRVKADSPVPGSLDRDVLGSWTPLVSVAEDDEDVHVLLRKKNERIREMLVVVSGSDELVIVKMKGRLDNMIGHAVGMGLKEAGREDLTQPVLEQLPDQVVSEGIEVS